MATKNANKTNKGVATKATAKKATKKVAPVIEPTDEVVLDAKSDITEVIENVVPEGSALCKPCDTVKEQTEANFSPSAKGGFRPICKTCQTAASLAWTTKRADYRKQYQRAIQLINLGIPAIVPNAKDWKQGDVIMTVEFTRDGVTYPSRNAEDVYSEMKQAQADAREARKAELATQNAELKTQRVAVRAELKAQRDAEKAEAKAQLATERAELKAKRDAERAEQAETARLEREAKAVERANARAEANAQKAETARLAREQKDAERAEARNQKAIERANAVAQKAEARKQAAIEKAMTATA